MTKTINQKPVGYLRRNLQVDEVSLVDKGANPGAKIALFKFQNRDNIDPNPSNGDLPAMTPEELQKALDLQKGEVEKTLSELTAVKADLAKAQEDLKKSEDAAKLAEAELAKAKKDKACKEGEPPELDDEMKKSMSPELLKSFDAMQKRLEESEKVQKDLNDKLELQSLEKQAEQAFPNLPGEPIQKAVLLRTMQGLPDVQKNYLEQVLKSANEAIGNKFEPIGKATNAVLKGDAQSQFDLLVKAHMAKNQVGESDATDAVMKTAEGKELYAKLA